MEQKSFKDTLKMIREGFNEWRYHNEASVRQGIILPILQSLGWNIFDTREVYPEHNVRGRRADYVLYEGNNPTVLIEAKALGRSQNEKENDIDQALEYTNAFNTKKRNIKQIIITDGLYWDFFEPDGKKIYKDTICILKDDTVKKIAEHLYKKDSNKTKNNQNVSLKRDNKQKLTLYDDFTDSNIIIYIEEKRENIHFKGESKDSKSMYEAFLKELWNTEKRKEKMLALMDNPKFIGMSQKGKEIQYFFAQKRRKGKKTRPSCPIKENVLYADADMGINEFAEMMRELLRYFGIWANNITKLEKFDKKEKYNTK